MSTELATIEKQKYYKVEAKSFSTCTISISGLEKYGSTPLTLSIITYVVKGITPKGVWVGYEGWDDRIFIQHSWRKKPAYPTLIEALEGFKKKKQRQISILASKLNDAKIALSLVEEEIKKQSR